MTDASTELKPAVHSTFRIERLYKASPARVFRALSNTEARRRWLVEGEGFEVLGYEIDFRVGGREVSRFRFGQSPEIVNETTFQDIVPDARIIYCYRMTMGGAPMSASLTTIELLAEGEGALLVQTEQGAYLDGLDDGTGREEGCRLLLEALAKEVEG